MLDSSPRVKNLIHAALVSLLVSGTAVAQKSTTRTAPIAQQHRPTKTAPGVVSGRVFAITKSGDVKPARMADVYLLWKYHSLAEALAEEKKGVERPFAALTFLAEMNKGMKAAFDDPEGPYHNSLLSPEQREKQRCTSDLGAIDKAIVVTMQWAVDQKKDYQIVATSADEEGNFRIKGVRPGVYDLLARGRAGFNEAFWHIDDVESDFRDITVAAGMETTIKLAAPVKSCFELGDDND